MRGAVDDPGALVVKALRRCSAQTRPLFLRELMAHAAAGLVVIEGEAAAGEAVYRLADAVVARGGHD